MSRRGRDLGPAGLSLAPFPKSHAGPLAVSWYEFNSRGFESILEGADRALISAYRARTSLQAFQRLERHVCRFRKVFLLPP